MRRAALAAAVLAVLVLGAAVFLVLRGTGGGEDVPRTGGGPYSFFEPRRVSPGIWFPPASDPEAQARGEAAAAADVRKPRFIGTLNGFPFIDPSEQAEIPDPCAGRKLTFIEDDLDAIPFELTYLPPDTFEYQPPYVTTCQDGQREIILNAVREFENGRLIEGEANLGAPFTVTYSDMEPVVLSIAPASRVGATTVNGHPGVIIRPVTPEGYAEGMVVFKRDDGGTVEIRGTYMPMDELLKIAEGVRCEGC